MPLAPSASAPARLGPAIAATLATHDAPAAVVERELSQMRDCRFGPTANRSVVGIMNEFAYLADVYRHSDPSRSLAELGRNWRRHRAARSTAAMSGRTVNSKHSCNSSSARTPEPTA